MNILQALLVTGGAGFIGSNFVRQFLVRHRDAQVTVLDKLTYAGNLANLADLQDDSRFRFVEGDIADPLVVDELATDAQAIVNFAAESHVDRSIEAPEAFIRTDVYGTYVLLEAAKRHRHSRFLQVSTDEVYGNVPDGSSSEEDPVRPRSPYAASKASGDLLVRAFYDTYDLPTLITRASNTFGPYQYPEKVVPLFITNAIDGEPLPLYGDGSQVRDWLYVGDHCDAIQVVLDRGEPGAVYNIGGGNELTNLELTSTILGLLDRPMSLVRRVADRPGHDRRYSLDCTRLKGLGWMPANSFASALARTVEWYVANEGWWRPLKNGAFVNYYERQYAERLRRSVELE